MPDAAHLLHFALDYQSRGWSIIRTAPGTKKAVGKWTQFQNQPADESQIRTWFGKAKDYGLAVVLGPVSGGLVCRDFDVQAAYDRWAAAHTDLATTLPTVATARGRHVYFRAAAVDLRFVDLRQIDPPEDGEYRGDSGHYCLLPPSRHPDGPQYIWLVPLPDGPIPLVPDVRAAGFLPKASVNTEGAENTGNELIELAVSSASSVSSVYTDEEKDQEGITPDRIERVIRECLPTGPGRRNRQVFELARGIKAMPELAGKDLEDLKPIVQRWHKLAMPIIKTKEFSETWIDFLQAWPRVKIPKGATMTTIMQKALEAPMPPVAERYEEERIQRLVALCYQLGREANGGKFFLSCRTAGSLLGVSHVVANRWLFLLDHDKVIKQLNKGNRGRREAAEYEYLGGRTTA